MPFCKDESANLLNSGTYVPSPSENKTSNPNLIVSLLD